MPPAAPVGWQRGFQALPQGSDAARLPTALLWRSPAVAMPNPAVPLRDE